jgi:uncharacterized iron-regulated membrane protein
MRRQFWVLVHRWAGLTMAGFLILVGLIGSLLAFYPEAERLINPQYYPASVSSPTLGPGELAAVVERRLPPCPGRGIALGSQSRRDLGRGQRTSRRAAAGF